MSDRLCGAPHPAYGDHDRCRKPADHNGSHKGSNRTDPWSDDSVRKFQPDHPWLNGKR